MNGYTFRQIMPAEKPALLALWDACKQMPLTLWNADYPGEAEADADLAEGHAYGLFDATGQLCATVSMEEDECLPLPCCALCPQPSVELSRIGVAQHCHGQGLAAQVVAEMTAHLAAQGMKAVHLLVSPLNLPAVKSYQRAGFHQIGTCEMWDIFWHVYEKRL